jgi:glycogen debranching enzyme
MAVAGMARYGEREAAAAILAEIYAAAAHFHLRLPELFCGFPRAPGEPPIAYPVACLPQAWAAGSVFLMLQATLGLTIDAWTGTVDLAAPVLPGGLERLKITGLQIGEAVVDLNIRHVDGRAVVLPRHRQGKVAVRTLR